MHRSAVKLSIWLPGIVLCTISVGWLCGCRSARRGPDAEFLDMIAATQEAYAAADPVSPAMAPVAVDLEGQNAVERYIQVALQQNPEIHAARKRLEALAYQVPVAASLQDPMLGMTFYPEEVQTAAGQQEFALSASQKVPWFGKLQRRAELVEAETDAARARLAVVELATIENVKRAYYELYFVQRAIDITDAEQQELIRIRKIVEARYTARKTSQQDLLRADVEVANVQNELIRLRQRLESAQARLARLLHVAPQTRVRALARLPEENLPQDLERLQARAVAARPELHAELASLERDRRAVDLARLEYFPDVTAGMTWIDTSTSGLSPVANGRDAVMINLGLNLPVYRGRLSAGVRSAQARAVSTAREYDALRDMTLEEVMDLFVQARSQQELTELFESDILPKSRQALEVSVQAYNVGEVDILQLLDNWRQLLRYELAYYRLEAGLRQTLASLERVVGGFGAPPAAPPAPPAEPLPPPDN